jgi:two-component system NtrC family sensor kinase
VQVDFQLSEDLPDVKGDRTRLAQIFLNVLANARQAMEESPIRRLGIRSFLDPGDGRFVVVEISDTGKGFSAEEAQKLFLPFFTTKKSGHGTGLGLSISKAIIKDHEGSIEARGAIGQGATFSIRLPAIEEAEEEERENHA